MRQLGRQIGDLANALSMEKKAGESLQRDLEQLTLQLREARAERDRLGDDLAAEFGTPLFVYDDDHLRARCREFVAAFGAGHVAFAGKSFLCTAMVRLVEEEGLHLDTASGGELHVALHAGIPAARITFHGNNKSDAELRRALTEQVGRIVADSDADGDTGIDERCETGGLGQHERARGAHGLERDGGTVALAELTLE